MKMLSKMRKNEKGFTLIELIVVIAILAILAAIAIPRLAGFTENARQGTDKEKAALIANAAAAYVAQHATDTGFTDANVTPANLIASGLVQESDFLCDSVGYNNDTTAHVAGGVLGFDIIDTDITYTPATGSVVVILRPHATTPKGATSYTVTK